MEWSGLTGAFWFVCVDWCVRVIWVIVLLVDSLVEGLGVALGLVW